MPIPPNSEPTVRLLYLDCYCKVAGTLARQSQPLPPPARLLQRWWRQPHKCSSQKFPLGIEIPVEDRQSSAFARVASVEQRIADRKLYAAIWPGLRVRPDLPIT